MASSVKWAQAVHVEGLALALADGGHSVNVTDTFRLFFAAPRNPGSQD